MSNKNLSDINEKIVKSREKTAQLEQQKKLRLNKEKEQKRKIDDRRKILIGNMVCKYFPEVCKFQPKNTTAENDIEFEKLDIILSLLSKSSKFFPNIIQKAEQKLSQKTKKRDNCTDE